MLTDIVNGLIKYVGDCLTYEGQHTTNCKLRGNYYLTKADGRLSLAFLGLIDFNLDTQRSYTNGFRRQLVHHDEIMGSVIEHARKLVEKEIASRGLNRDYITVDDDRDKLSLLLLRVNGTPTQIEEEWRKIEEESDGSFTKQIPIK